MIDDENARAQTTGTGTEERETTRERFVALAAFWIPMTGLGVIVGRFAYDTLRDLNHNTFLAAIIGGLVVAAFMGKK